MPVTQTENGGGFYTENRDGAAISPQPGVQNFLIYVLVQSIVILFQLLGGLGGYTFFGNIFLGLTVLCSLACLAIVSMTSDIDFAKTRVLGWWTVFPFVIGLLSLGFSWYFTWIIWWLIGGSMLAKKIAGDTEIEDLAKNNTEFPPPPAPTAGQVYNDVLRQATEGEDI